MLTFFSYKVINIQYAFLHSNKFLIFCWFRFYPNSFLSFPTPIHHLKREWVGHGSLLPHASRLWSKHLRIMEMGRGITGKAHGCGPGPPPPHCSIAACLKSEHTPSFYVCRKNPAAKKCLKSLHYISLFIQIPWPFKTMLGKPRKKKPLVSCRSCFC